MVLVRNMKGTVLNIKPFLGLSPRRFSLDILRELLKNYISIFSLLINKKLVSGANFYKTGGVKILSFNIKL